jgi:hypothetical protein
MSILKAWEQGNMDEESVLDNSEVLASRWIVWSGAPFVDQVAVDGDRTDARSALSHLISLLSNLHVEGVTRLDIPAMMQFLLQSATDPASAWEQWEKHLAGVDWERRRVDLAGHPLYGPFVHWKD